MVMTLSFNLSKEDVSPKFTDGQTDVRTDRQTYGRTDAGREVIA